nr:DUF2948 family protein [Pontibaca salina]
MNLGALEAEDLQVISSLAQDSVFPMTEMSWTPARHRFAILLNRFRWEDEGRNRHAPQRVRSLLVVDNVRHVSSQGLDRSDKDVILSLLSISFEPSDEVSGTVLLILAGDGAIRLDVETLEISLKDVTRPYVAPSGKTPEHND